MIRFSTALVICVFSQVSQVSAAQESCRSVYFGYYLGPSRTARAFASTHGIDFTNEKTKRMACYGARGQTLGEAKEKALRLCERDAKLNKSNKRCQLVGAHI